MTIEARAKVNLTLEVYAKRPDGYHALRSLVQPIGLSDTLTFEPAPAFSTDTGYADDLILKAARALSGAVGAAARLPRYAVRVTKRIPVGGGLGGGSADAAATLRALNELWHLGKSPEELASIGIRVGSDVPALVLAQHDRCCVRMEGRGEIVTRTALRPPSPHLVLANPGVCVSTAEVYGRCVPRTRAAQTAVNDLQEAACAVCPAIVRTLDALRYAGARDAMMSGSGPTCFGFVPDEATAADIAANLRAQGLESWPVNLLTPKNQQPQNAQS